MEISRAWDLLEKNGFEVKIKQPEIPDEKTIFNDEKRFWNWVTGKQLYAE